MPKLGIWEILLIVAIVVLIFGPGRIGMLRNAVVKAFGSFRKSVRGDDGE